jgi:hypothetical protein
VKFHAVFTQGGRGAEDGSSGRRRRSLASPGRSSLAVSEAGGAWPVLRQRRGSRRAAGAP